jgi:hypothetical protein
VGKRRQQDTMDRRVLKELLGDAGHKPITVAGRWQQCSVCHLTKRKAGWWKRCEGEPPSQVASWMGLR